MIEDGDMRMNEAVVADDHVVSDENARSYIRVFTNDGRVTDQLHSRLKRAEMTHNLQIGFKWLLHHQERLPGRQLLHRLVNDDITGRRPDTFVIKIRMVDKYKITFLYLMDLVNACRMAILITYE